MEMPIIVNVLPMAKARGIPSKAVAAFAAGATDPYRASEGSIVNVAILIRLGKDL